MPSFLPLITIPIALLCLGLALWDYRRTYRLVTTGTRTTGHYVGVTREVERTDESMSMTEYSVIEFTTAQHQSVQFQGRVGTIGRGRLVGQAVELYYDPQQPENARVASFFELWMVAIIFGTIGIALLVATPLIWFLLG